MLRLSKDEAARPDIVTLPIVGRVSPSPPFNRVHGQSMQLLRGLSGPDERDQTPPDVQIVLITQGGLELPLVDSPGRVAGLLEAVSEMAADIDRDGPMLGPSTADRRPHPVRTNQVLDRVRVVVRRCPSTSGDPA
jgi:hypothetical protein